MTERYEYDAARAAQLARRWDTMVITRQRKAMTYEAEEIIKNRITYAECERITGVPWPYIGVIDDREGGIENLTKRQLGQGDPLTHFSIHVPKGRPRVGHGPPFTWMECAVDALRLKRYHLIPKDDWTIERILHEGEPYNGLKYFYNNRPSPYIWSCCSIYDPPTGPGGKVLIDHGPIENVVDRQSGIAPLLKIIGELAPYQFLRAPPPTPLDDEDYSTEDLQTALNKLLPNEPPLTVDGRYGPATKSAVVVFQQTFKDENGNPLEVDGDAGPKTRAAIRKAYRASGGQ